MTLKEYHNKFGSDVVIIKIKNEKPFYARIMTVHYTGLDGKLLIPAFLTADIIEDIEAFKDHAKNYKKGDLPYFGKKKMIYDDQIEEIQLYT